MIQVKQLWRIYVVCPLLLMFAKGESRSLYICAHVNNASALSVAPGKAYFKEQEVYYA